MNDISITTTLSKGAKCKVSYLKNINNTKMLLLIRFYLYLN